MVLITYAAVKYGIFVFDYLQSIFGPVAIYTSGLFLTVIHVAGLWVPAVLTISILCGNIKSALLE